MKKGKRTIITFLVLAMSISVLPGSYSNAAKKVKLNKTKLTLKEGKSYTLKLKNNKKKVKWSSTKKKVATVTSKGKVKAKKAGSAKIIAKVGKKKYTCKVTVKKNNTNSDQKTNNQPTPKPNLPENNNTTTSDGITINLKKLSTYIETYGTTMESGDKFIWMEEDEFVGLISYNKMSDTFEFGYYRTDEDGEIASVLSMELKDKQEIHLVIWAATYGSCEGTINRKTYRTEADCDFSVTSSALEDDEFKEKLLELAYAELKLSTLFWEDLLYRAGLSLKDIGFVNWTL